MVLIAKLDFFMFYFVSRLRISQNQEEKLAFFVVLFSLSAQLHFTGALGMLQQKTMKHL